jgi:hypothetical protein
MMEYLTIPTTGSCAIFIQINEVAQMVPQAQHVGRLIVSEEETGVPLRTQ